MATLAFLTDPRQGITRVVLRQLVDLFGLEAPPQALKAQLQQILAPLPLEEIQEELNNLRNPPQLPGAHMPRIQIRSLLTPFTPGGNLPLFLKNFERTCRRNNIPERDFAAELHSVLPSSLTEILARLPDEMVDDYDQVKEELFKHFNFTAGGLRKEFLTLRRDTEESFV
jgi:hypothetical protein